MRIFLSVGAQMPFDRLVRAVDSWAAKQAHLNMFAQIGNTVHLPKSFEFTKFLEPSQFDERICWADGIVAHAGMGTILKSLQYGKPIVVLPRRAAFGETRNDHQIATALKFAEKDMLLVAMTEHDLPDRLSMLERRPPAEALAQFASPDLLGMIRSFIAGEEGNSGER